MEAEHKSQIGPENPPKKTRIFGVRHVIVALLFMAVFVVFASRVVFSVAIVAMTKNDTDFPSFDWKEKGVEGLILSSFFWGYAAGQIPSGLFVQSLGSKWPLIFSLGVSSLCVILTPLAAIYGDWIATCSIRVLQGFLQSALYPSIHASIAIWVPLEEKGRLSTLIFSGSEFGTILALPIGGFLIPSAGGWPSIFYLFGGIGLAWTVLWYFLGSSSPSEHPLMSEEERNIINSSLSNRFERKMKIPWREIFTTASFWAILVSHCAENFGFWTLMNEIPTYLDSVLKLKIEENGIISALPYLTMAVLSFVVGWISDVAFKKSWLTVSASRKIFNTIGFWGPAATLVALGFIGKDQKTLGIVLMNIAVGLNAGQYSGFIIGHMDLSPNFAGVLIGITLCIASLFSTAGTLLADEIIRDDKESTEKWQIVFSITAAMLFVGNLVYIILFKPERQPWNEPDYKRPRKSEISIT